ncbi:MAG: hypothetical protein HRT50_16990 [Colwellia sp.]|uniref:hypothetical protein n=1 Tax=Colwellia sp. TaxID=56799 RepID=UPI001D7D0EF4|nr:hypothetical protein [Colwellia sp.]NQY50759.1 hypothetical protein [Colwellia sp.]
MHELISDKLLYQSNKYATGKWQERVLPKETYLDEDVMAIFKVTLNLDHPIR